MSILQTVDLKKHYGQGDNVTKALDSGSRIPFSVMDTDEQFEFICCCRCFCA